VSSNVFGQTGGCSLAAPKRRAARVVVGGGAGFAAWAAERFLARGVDVCTAIALDELHAIAARKNPLAVVIPAESLGESGFLTAAKLRLTRPKMRVVLVGEASPAAERLARFVGARFATEATAADVVLKLI
jgi:ActR/RegA family two-component response regulator